MPTALKLSDELVESARRESSTWSRSMTQQVEHWARIGRAMELSGTVRMDRIRAALGARLAFDELAGDERAVVLGELERSLLLPDGSEAVAEKLRQRGRSFSGIDDAGRLSIFEPDGRVVPVAKKRRARSARSAAKRTPRARPSRNSKAK